MPLGHAVERVLVFAERFPSIHQPWIDRYLAQLLAHGFEVQVVTLSKAATSRHQQIAALGLEGCVIVVEAGRLASLYDLLRSVLTGPATTMSALERAWPRARGESSMRRRAAVLARAVRASGLIVRTQPRVVHVHSLGMAHALLPALEVQRIPLVLTFHGLNPQGVSQVPPHHRQAVFQQAKLVLVNTRFARDHAIELGCPADRLVVIPQGLPVDTFPFRPRAAPSAGEPMRLLSVARFHRDKGQGYSLLALKRLHNVGIAAHFHFAGVGPRLERLRTLAEKLGVHSHVTFHVSASTSELLHLYQTCHLFVLASVSSADGQEHVETQGVVLQEAQASGCIPIATRVGGIPECVRDGVDGVVVPERSALAIANAVLELHAAPERWAAMQREGRRNVEERFSAQVVGAQVGAALRAAMGRSPLI